MDVINGVIQEFVPKTKPKTKSKHPPWFSRDLIKRLREKNKYRKRFKIYKNPLDQISFRILTDRCNKLASECYKSYLNKVENGIETNPKLFWSYVKSKRGGTSTYPATISDGTTETSNGYDICNGFASHFSSVVPSGSSSGSVLTLVFSLGSWRVMTASRIFNFPRRRSIEN